MSECMRCHVTGIAATAVNLVWATAGEASPDGTEDSQQRLDTVADGGASVSGDEVEGAAGQAGSGADAKQLRDHVQQAIAALEAVQSVIEDD